MTVGRWQVAGDVGYMRNFFLLLSNFLVLVILSAQVERLSVSRMQDFVLLKISTKKAVNLISQQKNYIKLYLARNIWSNIF